MEEGQVFGGGNLDHGFKELLAAVIAYNRGTEICIAWHTTSAAIENVEPERFAIAADFDNQKEQLSERERKAVEFSVKCVKAPTTVTDDDIQELRDLGYSDADIIELTTTAGTAAKFANFALTPDLTSLPVSQSLERGPKIEPAKLGCLAVRQFDTEQVVIAVISRHLGCVIL